MKHLTEDEFTEVLRYCSGVLGHDWECRDRLSTTESGMEFGFVLGRAGRRRPRRFARQLDSRRSLVDRAFDQSRR